MEQEQEEQVEQNTEWVIRFKGRTYGESDLTGDHLMHLAVTCGDDWGSMTPLKGPISLMSFLVVFHCLRTGDDANKTWEEVKMLSVDDLLDCMEIKELQPA